MVSGEDVECTGPRLQVHGNSGLKCDSKHRARDALRDHENSTPLQHITILSHSINMFLMYQTMHFSGEGSCKA